jgi:atypical dual specificity phosphatase
MESLLRLEGFGLAFEQRVILRDVSFDIPLQGCTVLLGPAGTGKSSLLRTLSGLMAGNSRLRLWGT